MASSTSRCATLVVEGDGTRTTYPLPGDELDLEPLAHDACILELPLAPLCGEDCLGLCPECGVNRNLEPCSCCRARTTAGRLGVLLGGGPDGGRTGAVHRVTRG